MGSNFDNPSEWRLRTAGGIPYKYIGEEGSFSYEDANVKFSVLIQSTQLLAFMTELFPEPLRIGGRIIPRPSTLPGLGTIPIRRVTFKSFDAAVPVDPFGFDINAANGTYYQVLRVDIEYSSGERNGENSSSDPTSFLEISADASGEFFHTTAPKSKWGGGIEDGSGGTREPVESSSKEANRSPDAPVNILVPQVEWNVKYKQIPYSTFRDEVHPTLKRMLGRVNESQFRIIFSAYPETLLFTGFRYQLHKTWREGGSIETSPVTLDMTFLEKRIEWNGSIVGHNEFWRPGVGWETLYVDGSDRKVYSAYNFNRLFNI